MPGTFRLYETPITRMRELVSDADLHFVKSGGKALHNVARHRRVNFTGKLNEPCRQVEFMRLPGQIEGIDRNPMAPKSRTWIEWYVAKRLSFCRVDHFPNINSHRRVNHLQLIYECDVGSSKYVFGELDGFRSARVGHWNNLAHKGAVEVTGEFRGDFVTPRSNLRDRGGPERIVSRVLALGRKTKE